MLGTFFFVLSFVFSFAPLLLPARSLFQPSCPSTSPSFPPFPHLPFLPPHNHQSSNPLDRPEMIDVLDALLQFRESPSFSSSTRKCPLPLPVDRSIFTRSDASFRSLEIDSSSVGKGYPGLRSNKSGSRSPPSKSPRFAKYPLSPFSALPSSSL